MKGKQSALKVIASAWLLAGTLDITVASIYHPLAYGIKLLTLYQGIASGIFGAKAFSGGAGTAALGLACHYLIALIWTVFFFIIFPKIRILSKHLIATAIAYGIFVSLVMTFAVLPLSNVHHSHTPVNVVHFAINTVILMFTIGTPLSAIIGRRFVRR